MNTPMHTSSDEDILDLDDSGYLANTPVKDMPVRSESTIQSTPVKYPGVPVLLASTPVKDVPVSSASTSQNTDVKEDGVLMATAKEFVRNGNNASAYRAIAFGILDRAKATRSQKQTWEDRLTELDDFIRNHPGN